VIYLAIEQASKKWTMPIQSWRMALNRFVIEFGDRLNGHQSFQRHLHRKIYRLGKLPCVINKTSFYYIHGNRFAFNQIIRISLSFLSFCKLFIAKASLLH